MRLRLWSGALLLALPLACASTPPPKDEVAAAETALRDAELAGAQTHAAAEWNRSRLHLEEAREAMRDERDTTARRLAEIATAEAQLAAARARAATAASTAAEQARTVQQLQDEAGRAKPPVERRIQPL